MCVREREGYRAEHASVTNHETNDESARVSEMDGEARARRAVWCVTNGTTNDGAYVRRPPRFIYLLNTQNTKTSQVLFSAADSPLDPVLPRNSTNEILHFFLNTINDRLNAI